MLTKTLNKSIIQELENVNNEVSIEGTSAEEILRSVHTLLNPRITREVKSSKEIIKSKKYIKPKNYKKDEAYMLIEVEKDDTTGKKRIRDIRPFKTMETLLKILYDISSIFDLIDGISVSYMFTPNPVKIPRDYYIEYKKARDPRERKKLATKYKLLTDDSILNISY
ncbi:MAG: hypothetical protein ACP5H3_04120, partial [Candidatus Aenigmatarchaeota archaeon]